MGNNVRGDTNWAKQYANPTQQNLHNVRKLPHGFGPPTGVAGVKCNPRNLSFTEKPLSIQKTIARFVLPAETSVTGTFTPTALIYTPSVRMRVKVTVAFEPDNQSAPDPSFQVGNNPTWNIQAMQRNPETGRESPLRVVYPSAGTQNLPDGYEFDSGSELLRVNIANLKDTSLAAAFVPNTERCNLVLCVQWEPNVEMSNEERDMLLSKCAVTFGSPIILQNNAV